MYLLLFVLNLQEKLRYVWRYHIIRVYGPSLDDYRSLQLLNSLYNIIIISRIEKRMPY